MTSTIETTKTTVPYQGLTTEEVAKSRAQHGKNVLKPPEREPWWQLFLEKFEDPVIEILCIAAVIAIAVGIVEGDYIEGLGIIVAIILATTLAFINEYKASKEFDILNQVYDTVPVKVIRDGRFTTVPRQDIVVGDVIYLEQGEEIPADGNVLEELTFYVDQSKITGESEAAQKITEQNCSKEQAEAGTYPPYRVFRSTLVDRGNAFVKITEVGDGTEIGQLAIAVAVVGEDENTPLNLQLEKLSKLIGVVGLAFASLTFVALLARGFVLGEYSLAPRQWYFFLLAAISTLTALSPVWLPVVYDALELSGKESDRPAWLEAGGLGSWGKALGVGLLILGLGVALSVVTGLDPAITWFSGTLGNAILEYFMIAVTIIVVAVPEGLAMSVTLSLAYSMKKMAKDNNLVRQMHACETIGAATVICSDKTGTLTQNQMQVKEVNFPILKGSGKDAQQLIAEAIAVNTTAELDIEPNEPPRPLGNATEGSLLLWLNQDNLDYLTYRNQFEIKERVPFSTETKYMATLGTSKLTSQLLLHVKGAPEVLLQNCPTIATADGLQSFTEEQKAEISQSLIEYQKKGMRTLGFAYQADPEAVPTKNLDNNLIWLGFTAIEDPLRIGVADSIATCLKSGVQVKIVTGDTSETAKEIARQIGIQTATESKYSYLTGKEFGDLSDRDAQEAVKDLKVLSRARPLDKLRLVKLLQKNGEVVSVTGDGTNDCAALKQAQVGLSMGSGTAIAKESSDIILLDDSFGSIVNAIIWGRSLYSNIQRFILFQLTINVAALGIVLLGPFIGVALPLTVTQMLWVNLIMDTFAALALATEPPNPKVMEDSPRSPDAFIISPQMTKNIAIVGLIFLVILTGFLLYIGRDNQITDYELSLFFSFFVMLQFWNLFNARCLGLDKSAFANVTENKGFVLIATMIFLGQVFIIQFGGEMFRTVPLSLNDWLFIVGGTSIVLWIGELTRFFKRMQNT
ncbi:plasma-membrane calcium-translocating P-type ATPase [Xenococcus sp. PCC 7305]|uniref:calcium-translocating P-type ATPase, PMCA-type n=1 Tax=Xenococcus sp. PCC 7305 TaxID=102125 RepID=UPI0002AC4466|nr:calcium-translocating P-type ATPase, PMCA-type [Xenococcus sp. PCC 7305]ELS04090.1 plasma-membrane calcium-translocating P-type ATPase [Xenococcus sp. PCC 7305]